MEKPVTLYIQANIPKFKQLNRTQRENTHKVRTYHHFHELKELADDLRHVLEEELVARYDRANVDQRRRDVLVGEQHVADDESAVRRYDVLLHVLAGLVQRFSKQQPQLKS